VELAGRAGELNLSVDLDNLNVQYEQFASNVLAAGQSLVLVKNIAAFQSLYGTNILIGGQYSGALTNTAQRLALVGAWANRSSIFRMTRPGTRSPRATDFPCRW